MTTNEEGKGRGCACRSTDPQQCYFLRYHVVDYAVFESDDDDDWCECLCHEWEDDDISNEWEE